VECNAVSLGEWLPDVTDQIGLVLLEPEDEGFTFFRNVGNHSPYDITSHSRRLESSRFISGLLMHRPFPIHIHLTELLGTEGH
jgi:hypothetical protein